LEKGEKGGFEDGMSFFFFIKSPLTPTNAPKNLRFFGDPLFTKEGERSLRRMEELLYWSVSVALLIYKMVARITFCNKTNCEGKNKI